MQKQYVECSLCTANAHPHMALIQIHSVVVSQLYGTQMGSVWQVPAGYHFHEPIVE